MATEISINSVRYTLYEEQGRVPWETVERGQDINWSRDYGWLGGMGSFTERSNDDYLFGRNVDTATYPFLRLPPTPTLLNVSGLQSSDTQPTYLFRARSSHNWVYILNGRYAYKLHESAGSLESTYDFGAGAVAGRPALFEDSWYVPLANVVPYGGGVVTKTLDTIANDGAGADTWGNAGTTPYYARHLAIVNDGGVSKLAMAGSGTSANPAGNTVGYSADGDAPSTTFEANDSSLPISDLLGGAEVTVVDPSAVYRMDTNGNAVAVQDFVGRHYDQTYYVGSNSFMYGPYFYWPHTSGLWRFVGDAGKPIGPDADPHWVNRTLDGFTPFRLGIGNLAWTSIAAWGGWVYATYGRSLFYGPLNEDGTVRWHGLLYQGTSNYTLRCFIAESSTGSPILWVTQSGAVRRYALAEDGAPRTIDDDRGTASTTHQFWGPVIDGGTKLATKNKQWRVMGAELEGDWDSDSPLQCAAHMNGAATSTSVGATITSTGSTERTWTRGTTDTARYIIPTWKIVTGAGHTSGDPRIRRVWVRGVTPMTYAARIDLRATIGDWEGMLTDLRDLASGGAVTIIAPGQNTGFTGYIRNLYEEWQPRGGYVVQAIIERYDWGGA